jgi:hypothetical protein
LNDRWVNDVGRVQIGVLLELVSLKTIMRKADLRRGKVIRRLKLKPFVRAIN